MGPLDANGAGSIHGGTVMRFCDEAAALAAIRHSHCHVVTAGVDRVTFLLPIQVGHLVSFRATVNAVWRSSMEVGVRVEAENPVTGEVIHTNSAYFTMVALGTDRRPTPVPALIDGSPIAQRREAEAQARRRNRLAEREATQVSRRAKGER